MGTKSSKNDCNSIIIPNNYKMIKIKSYNVRLNFGSPLRADKIGYYLENSNDIDNDIICLQGIYDNESRDIIINYFKNYENIYVIPEKNNKSKNSLGLVILSKHPVIDYYCCKFNENEESIKEYSGIICVNLCIDNNIISIYNVQLQSDYKNIISNSNIRKKQLEILDKTIKENINHINNTNLFKTNIKTNINLVVGSLNISGENLLDIYLTEEYKYVMNNFNYLDIFKMLNKKEYNFFINRNDYFLLYINDDKLINQIKNNNSELIQFLEEKQKNNNYILQDIFKKYKINLIDSKIENIDYSDHYPIELYLLIKIKN